MAEPVNIPRYLYMGYYSIYILPKSRDLAIIVAEIGKYRYNMVPMVLWASGDIFQDKVDEILSDI